VAEAAKQALEKKSPSASERRKRLSEEKFSKAFRSSPDSITISALKDGRYVEVNDSCLRLLGYHREEVIGHTSIELNIWATQRIVTECNRFCSNRGHHNLESNFRTKSGKVRVLLSAEIITLAVSYVSLPLSVTSLIASEPRSNCCAMHLRRLNQPAQPGLV